MARAPVDVGVADSLGYGWRAFRANAAPLVAIALVVAAINLTIVWLDASVATAAGTLGVTLLNLLVSSIISMGWIRVALEVVDGERPQVRDLFVTAPIAPYLAATLVFSLAVALGFVLLVVPGIYLALRYGFYGYGIVEKGLGVADAFRHSSERTEGHRWQLLALALVLLLLNVVAALPLGLGLLVTSPLTVVTLAYVYRRLGGEPVADTDRPASQA